MTAISGYKSISFHDLKVAAHAQAMQAFNQEYPLEEAALENLESLGKNLVARLSELQGGKAVIPSSGKLLDEQQTYITAYWKFRETAQKAREFAKELLAVELFLTPQFRCFSDEESLKNDASKLQRSINACDEITLKLKLEVADCWSKVEALQIKMFEQLDTDVSYSLQKFIQIVENDGIPSSGIMWIADYIFWPVIPKLETKEIEGVQASFL